MDVFDRPVKAKRILSVATGWHGAPDLSGVRAEQIRRARLVVAAAGRAHFPEKTPEIVVARLAKYLPGLRYSTGLLVYSSLAPVATVAPPPSPFSRPNNTLDWTADAHFALIAAVSRVLVDGRARTIKAALSDLKRAEKAGQPVPIIPTNPKGPRARRGEAAFPWKEITPEHHSLAAKSLRPLAADYLVMAEESRGAGESAKVSAARGWLMFEEAINAGTYGTQKATPA